MTAPVSTRRVPAEPGPVRGLLALLTGGLVGWLTFLGQGELGDALSPLVNSASAWLVAPFLVGAVARTPLGAAGAGLTTCLMQLVGYYLAAGAHGYHAGGGIVLFWTACGLVGGPLFGASAWWWRHGRGQARELGAAVLPCAFLAEGIWTYAITLGSLDRAVLWLAVGALLAGAMLRGWAARRWLILVLPLALLGEVAVTALAAQPL